MEISEIIFELKKKYLNKVFVKKNKNKVIKLGAMILILFTVLIIFLTGIGNDNDIETQSEVLPNDTVQDVIVVENIVVDVGGEVMNPQVVKLPIDSRVEDAIIAAGGLTSNADVSTINRALILSDGEKIYIPSFEEVENGITEGQIPIGEVFFSKVNINTANSTMLQEIQGVGPATALKIIDYRNENGKFEKIEDIMNVSGIGEKTFEEMKDDISV